jgi:Tfp pilus assembly protein PilN
MRAVNLIPSEQRSGQAVGAGRSQGAAYAVLALVAGLAIVTLLYGRARHQIEERRSQAAALTAKAQQAEAAANQLAPYTSFLTLREQRVQAVNTLVGARFDWAHVFHEFGRVLPRGTSISSLTGTVGTGSTTTPAAAPAPSSPSSSSSTAAASTSSSTGASSASAVTSATPPGSIPVFTLSGCATSQPVVALMLERLRLIDGVSEVTLQSSTAGSSGTGSAGGGCPPHGPAFTLQVTFDPLPAVTAPSNTAVADDAGAGSAQGSSATTEASAR